MTASKQQIPAPHYNYDTPAVTWALLGARNPIDEVQALVTAYRPLIKWHAIHEYTNPQIAATPAQSLQQIFGNWNNQTVWHGELEHTEINLCTNNAEIRKGIFRTRVDYLEHSTQEIADKILFQLKLYDARPFIPSKDEYYK